MQTQVADDFEVIHRVLHGEIDLFAELITRYQQHVARIVNRHVPPDRVAEVAHDVFVRAYSGLPGFSGRAPFEHWLSRLAVTTCLDALRAENRRPEWRWADLGDSEREWLDFFTGEEPAPAL